MENPYQSPLAEVTFQPRRAQRDARLDDVASGQKLVIYAILLYFVAIFLAAIVPILPPLLVIASIGMSWVGIYRISRGIDLPVWARVLMILLTVLPLIGLLVLLRLSNRATKELKQAGYSVGLLGARDY